MDTHGDSKGLGPTDGTLGAAVAAPSVEAWDSRFVLSNERAFGAWLGAREPDRVAASSPEAARARATAEALARTVAKLAANPMSADAAIDELLDAGVPGDVGWTELFVSLRLVAGHESYKTLALARYRRYLIASPAPVLLSDSPCGPTTLDTGEPPPEGLVRIERGARLPIVAEAPFDLWLAGRRCLLDPRPARFVDSLGKVHELREGANLVGRALYAEVPIDESLADVSRRHLVVEVSERRVVSLTDLSSRGTCVPAEAANDAD